jgi:hypothetical protein
MLYTEPVVEAVRLKLGFFDNYEHQQRADLSYGGQDAWLRRLAERQPEARPDGTIPAPPTPPTR